MHGQLRKGAGQQRVQLIDQPRVLFGSGLQKRDRVAELPEFRRVVRRGGGPLDHGEARAGQALGGISFAFVEVNLAVSLVPRRLPDGDRGVPVETVKPLQQVLGILTGGVDADVQIGAGMLPR